MFNIRRMEPKDLIDVQRCNQYNLPENYPMVFWTYSVITWPEASFLAEDLGGKIVGYVLASVEQAEENDHLWVGHINSLAVLRPYRRLGLAKRLMTLSKESMMDTYPLQYIQLHVRISNRAALSLYRDALGYTVHSVDYRYYADGEDAFSMRLWINGNPDILRHRWKIFGSFHRFMVRKHEQLAYCFRGTGSAL
ncbi:acyl-CoA N-acyltransferase [Scleroderma yunnanense]